MATPQIWKGSGNFCYSHLLCHTAQAGPAEHSTKVSISQLQITRCQSSQDYYAALALKQRKEKKFMYNKWLLPDPYLSCETGYGHAELYSFEGLEA